MTTHAARAALLTLLVLLPACSSLERPAPERRFVSIDAERPRSGPPGSAPAPFPGNLRVADFRMSPRFSGRELVYRLGANEWSQDYYTHFVQDPGRDLAEQTRRWLKESNLFHNVLEPSSRAEAPWAIDAYVAELYGDFLSSPPRAVITIEFHLIDDSDGAWRIVGRYAITRSINPAERTVPALVRAWSEGLAAMLADLETSLRAAAPAPH